MKLISRVSESPSSSARPLIELPRQLISLAARAPWQLGSKAPLIPCRLSKIGVLIHCHERHQRRLATWRTERLGLGVGLSSKLSIDRVARLAMAPWFPACYVVPAPWSRRLPVVSCVWMTRQRVVAGPWRLGPNKPIAMETKPPGKQQVLAPCGR